MSIAPYHCKLVVLSVRDVLEVSVHLVYLLQISAMPNDTLSVLKISVPRIAAHKFSVRIPCSTAGGGTLETGCLTGEL